MRASTPGLRETPPRSGAGGWRVSYGRANRPRHGLYGRRYWSRCTDRLTSTGMVRHEHSATSWARKGTLWPRPGAAPRHWTPKISTTRASCWNPAWTSHSRERLWSVCTETRRAAPWASRPAGLAIELAWRWRCIVLDLSCRHRPRTGEPVPKDEQPSWMNATPCEAYGPLLSL